MPVEASDLDIGLWPRVGYAEPAALIDAWRQMHHAAQGLVELGKSWATPRDDDAHSALVWSDEDAGWLAHGNGPLGDVIGWLDLGGGSVWIERRDPQEGAWLELEARTVADVRAWVRASAERLTGSASRQDARPAPDLPAHAVGNGAPISIEDADARADLEALYEGAGLLLDRLRESLDGRLGAHDDDATPRLWPHHFDAASLFVAERDGGGEMLKTIGVGLTPPDGVERSGYWYVSPWTAGGGWDAARAGVLAVGRWHARGDGPAMAVLPLDELVTIEDGDGQLERISAFLAASLDACARGLDIDL